MMISVKSEHKPFFLNMQKGSISRAFYTLIANWWSFCLNTYKIKLIAKIILENRMFSLGCRMETTVNIA